MRGTFGERVQREFRLPIFFKLFNKLLQIETEIIFIELQFVESFGGFPIQVATDVRLLRASVAKRNSIIFKFRQTVAKRMKVFSDLLPENTLGR